MRRGRMPGMMDAMERPNLPKGLPSDIEDKKERARQWFESLRDAICSEFEMLEDQLAGPLSNYPAGRFHRKQWLLNHEGAQGEFDI